MDDSTYQKWWQLHLRIARGETLSAEQQNAYDAGLVSLDQNERLRVATDARYAREQWNALNSEHSALERHRRELDTEIAELESRLNHQTRQLLGVED